MIQRMVSVFPGIFLLIIVATIPSVESDVIFRPHPAL